MDTPASPPSVATSGVLCADALPSPDDEQAYSDWLDTLTTQCTCEGVDKPCDGLLAGGLCDDLHLCSDAFAADLDSHNA